MQQATLFSRRIVVAMAAACFTLGLVVFVGWATDTDAMQRAFMGQIHMLPNPAVGFMAAALSLVLLRDGAHGWKGALAGRLLAAGVLLLGVFTFTERVYGVDFGIDRLLFADAVARKPYRPLGRMATNSTVAFALTGGALLLLDVVTRRGRQWISLWLSTGALIISGVALVGYLFGSQLLYSMDAAAAMATSTATAFFVLNLGIVFARPGRGWATLLVRRGGGARLARRLLVAVLLVPMTLGWLYIRVRESELLSRENATAILVVAVAAVLLAITLQGAAVVQATIEREEAARREAERANDAKNDFLAVMSHELRTPLNAIIGYGSLLRDGIPDPVSEGQRRQLDRIASSARHLLALIDEVLTVSRIELREEQVHVVTVDVATAMQEAASLVETQAREKGLAFVVELPEAPLTLQTDAHKLRQSLVNLLGNAVKFTDAGEVRLRARLERDGEWLAFDVADTGIGVDPRYHQRIFESFWQVDQAPTRRAGGVGLGLHVTRQLARLLGGDVTVASTPGKGSCFSLALPLTWWGDPGSVVRPAEQASSATTRV
jgi:signal transduction histidine kinase